MALMEQLSSVNLKFAAVSSTTVALTAGLYGLRKWFDGGSCSSLARLDGKTVLITGGNTGIGKTTAIDLAKRGARVVIACKDLQRGQAALDDIKKISGNKDVVLKILDLSSFQSVRNFADDFLNSEPKLHILINNAGIMACPRDETKDGLEMQIGVNHFGHFLLTNLLLERLKQCAPSRVVIVSSLAHIKGVINFDDLNSEKKYEPWFAYRQSKLANNLMCHELAKRLEGTGVSTFCLHPGIVKTELGRHSFGKTLLRRILLTPVSWLILKSPEQGAQTSIYCAVQEGIEKYSGKYFADCSLTSSPKSEDDGASKKLWELSERIVGV